MHFFAFWNKLEMNFCLINRRQSICQKEYVQLEGGAQLSGIAQKLAYNKKSTIFVQRLRKLAKIKYSWVLYNP